MDLARELKKLWNMKLTEISIVTCVPRKATKGLIMGFEDLAMSERV